MRIALLTYSTKPRGSVIHTLELADALTKLGHWVCIYALDKDGLGFEQPPSCVVKRVPAKKAPANADALIRQRIQEFVDFLAVEAASFDIYHAQDCLGANALLELRQRSLIAHFIRTVHHVETYPSPYLRRCQDKSICLPDLCLCVSDRWRQALKIDYAIEAPRIINGVNLQRFSLNPSGRETELKQRYRLRGDPIFLTVGGIEPRKNSLALVKAFAQVLQTHPNAQLVIVGGSTLFDYQSYRETVFHLVKSLNIEVGRSLILPGVIPAAELDPLYRCSDVFCFPSLKEGWGLVVLEAIASGLPVVVPQSPPFTEYLAADQALWINPHQPETITSAMLKALTPEGQDCSIRSRTVLANYSWERSAEMHVGYYRQLLASYGSGGSGERRGGGAEERRVILGQEKFMIRGS